VTTAQARHPRSTPPAQPTDADKQLLLFAQGVELAARDLYKKAVESGKYSDDEAAMLTMFGEHHNTYAQAMNGLIGKVATNKRNDSLYSTHVGQLGSAQSAYAALQSLENTWLQQTPTSSVSCAVWMQREFLPPSSPPRLEWLQYSEHFLQSALPLP
jgi:hypothetical protein